MVHSIRESNLESMCPSCKTEHNCKWTPEFWNYVHYKTCICPKCDYKISIRTLNFSSGHY